MIYMGTGIFLFILCLMLFWVQGSINQKIRDQLLAHTNELQAIHEQIRLINHPVTAANHEIIHKLIELDSLIAGESQSEMRAKLICELEEQLNIQMAFENKMNEKTNNVTR